MDQRPQLTTDRQGTVDRHLAAMPFEDRLFFRFGTGAALRLQDILRSGKGVKQIEATCEEVAPAPAARAALGQSLAIMQGISRASAGASPIKRRSIP